MADQFFLTADDREILRRVIAEARTRIKTPRRGSESTIEREEMTTPETYLARTPDAGVPALAENTTGTGTTDDVDDVLTSALCEIYQLVQISPLTPGTRRLVNLGFTHRVFNVAPVALPARQLVLITRDKFGVWYFTAPWLDFATC
jgi:hypothetical protein